MFSSGVNPTSAAADHISSTELQKPAPEAADSLRLGFAVQSGVANGSIRGVVHDASGAVVPGVDVRARNLATGFSRNAQTNEFGQFDLPLLPLGSYEVEAAASGFSTFRQSPIGVELDKASNLTIALRVAGAESVIAVEADAPIVNSSTFDVVGRLDQRSMENMPITSRNSFNLALLAPGFNGRRDDEFGNPTFAFGGMQRRGFLIDGIDNTQRGGPGRLGIFSPESLQEVKVIHNAMAAEYGRTVGGMINMVTRGGTNDFHGTCPGIAASTWIDRKTFSVGNEPIPTMGRLHGHCGRRDQERQSVLFRQRRIRTVGCSARSHDIGGKCARSEHS